jgi:transposase InsO family protein
MPWKLTLPEDQRVQFIVEALYGESSLADLCRSFAISRKTGYKWLARYEQEGPMGLIDRSRAPHHHPHALDPDIAARLLALRKKHPTWGARKLLAWLEASEPELSLPAVSTVNALLKRMNLVHPRRFRHRVPPMTAPFGSCAAPNDTWCVDFKGWFRVGDGSRCDPLTISDAFSRFLLCCQAVPGTSAAHVRPIFEAAFKEYGLPNAIRSDNGPPFATRGAGGLSALSVWWILLGIVPERIDPGSPEQNGRHERMHLTLKTETAQPPRHSLRAQQGAFDRFRKIFNHERPHEALGQRPPATAYEPSLRRMPSHLPEMTYPGHFEVRHANRTGCIKWNGRHVYIGECLARQHVGLEQIGDTTWLVRFGPIELGRLKDDAPQLGLIRPRRSPKRHSRPP